MTIEPCDLSHGELIHPRFVYLTEDGLIITWTGSEWTDGDLSFAGTLATGPQGIDA